MGWAFTLDGVIFLPVWYARVYRFVRLGPEDMILDLHHIQVAMPIGQEETARAFYCGILKFSEVVKPSELQGRGGIWLRAQHVLLHLGVEDQFTAARKAHPGFRVSSLKKVISHLEARGCSYRTDIDLPDIKRIYIDDPFGNRIELLEVITS
jgi:catechol 2,3-dioxygenase-like lactoylglutathione lyase family enzyme